MKIGLIAIAGVKLQTRKFIDLGITLPQFVNRGRVIAQLPSLALLTIAGATPRSEEHTSELQSRGLISYAVFCLKKKQRHIDIDGDEKVWPQLRRSKFVYTA